MGGGEFPEILLPEQLLMPPAVKMRLALGALHRLFLQMFVMRRRENERASHHEDPVKFFNHPSRILGSHVLYDLRTEYRVKRTVRVVQIRQVSFDTGYGVLTISLKKIRGMYQCDRARGFGDDFETRELEGWQNFGGTWKINNGKLDISGANNYSTIALYNEEVPDTYTLEVEVKGTGTYGLVWHAKNQNNATVLWMTRNLTYVFGGQIWWNQQRAQWSVPLPNNKFNRVRLEVEKETATLFINDKEIGKITTHTSAGKVGLFCFNGKATFDNFWIH